MMIPQLVYSTSPDSDKVACAVALVPTFDAVAPQDFFELNKAQKPMQEILMPGSEFHFIFLIDRSGSMSSY